MKQTQLVFHEHVPKAKERTYFERTFSVPEGICRIDIRCEYQRYLCAEQEGISRQKEVSVIDLALRDGRGRFLGASGAGKDHIWISGWDSTAGYARTDPDAGEWAIIIGAYHVADGGTEITYTVTFTHEERVLLKGDTHLHTVASDGVLSTSQAAEMARTAGLDFLFITDHNGYAHNQLLPESSNLTLLPGSEWTHYEGHVGMLGVSRPFQSPFCINSPVQVRQLLAEARENGALVVLNHPFCPNCGWHFGISSGGFDLVEAINGGTSPSANAECIRWWHEQLCQGEHLGIIGGSDYHRPEPGRQLGQPATAVYALSRSPREILAALRRGSSYLILWPGAPTLWAGAQSAILGETAGSGDEISIRLTGLRGEDQIRLITDLGHETLVCGPDTSALQTVRRFPGAKFVRFEVLRHAALILLSNPIYFA
ncbi:CehA/McbA family metallohydrolase [Dysosmobacter sp.]